MTKAWKLGVAALLCLSGVWLLVNGIAFYFSWIAYEPCQPLAPCPLRISLPPQPNYSPLLLSYLFAGVANQASGLGLVISTGRSKQTGAEDGRRWTERVLGGLLIVTGLWFLFMAGWPRLTAPRDSFYSFFLSGAGLYYTALYSLISVPLANIGIGAFILWIEGPRSKEAGV